MTTLSSTETDEEELSRQSLAEALKEATAALCERMRREEHERCEEVQRALDARAERLEAQILRLRSDLWQRNKSIKAHADALSASEEDASLLVNC